MGLALYRRAGPDVDADAVALGDPIGRRGDSKRRCCATPAARPVVHEEIGNLPELSWRGRGGGLHVAEQVVIANENRCAVAAPRAPNSTNSTDAAIPSRVSQVAIVR